MAQPTRGSGRARASLFLHSRFSIRLGNEKCMAKWLRPQHAKLNSKWQQMGVSDFLAFILMDIGSCSASQCAAKIVNAPD